MNYICFTVILRPFSAFDVSLELNGVPLPVKNVIMYDDGTPAR